MHAWRRHCKAIRVRLQQAKSLPPFLPLKFSTLTTATETKKKSVWYVNYPVFPILDFNVFSVEMLAAVMLIKSDELLVLMILKHI